MFIELLSNYGLFLLKTLTVVISIVLILSFIMSTRNNKTEGDITIKNINEEFSKFIDDMDNRCIKYTYENATEWFKKEIPHDALTNMYENIDTDDGTIRIDFPSIKDKLQCKIYYRERCHL